MKQTEIVLLMIARLYKRRITVLVAEIEPISY